MMQLIIRPTAEMDVQEASDWYEEREPGLGASFLDELRNTFTRIRLMPLQFPNIRGGLRGALLHRFPYAIYFVTRDERRVVVIAVLHQHRSPSVLKKRLRAEGKPG